MAVAKVARQDRIRHAGDRQGDRRRRLERAVAVAHRDRDTVSSAQGDSHVEVVIVAEVADRDRCRFLVGIGERGVALGPQTSHRRCPSERPSGATMSVTPLLVKSPAAIGVELPPWKSAGSPTVCEGSDVGVNDVMREYDPDPARLWTSRMSVPEATCWSIRGFRSAEDWPSL